ncbi:MAG: hypothetical protein HPY57_15380 [Ignavibacteria bacterium]|nr:hypothetical protein [Ignavibacteria bacterium]
MKTLNKTEFILFLKTISDTLEKEEIQYELPFCHIDKVSFNHMYIVIPDHITSYDISKIFNCDTVNEKEGIITSVIDDFTIYFVKTNQHDWYYTFWYYCWNILPIMIDILAFSSYNLRYTRFGLKYQYNDKLIDITKNMKDIFDFLELPFHMISNGFPTDYTIFEFIESSPYFDTNFFTMEVFKKFDKNFEFNKKYYEDFIKHKPEITGEIKSEDEQIFYIDTYFNGSNFLEKLSKLQAKNDNPGIQEKLISIEPKSIEDLKNKKKEEINKRKRINLKKIIDNKDDKDFKFNIE